MWKLLLLVLFALLSFTQCYKKATVGPRPTPMKNFIPSKINGRWYVQARFITCHYQGARGFTDSTSDYTLVENEHYAVTNTHRVGELCANVVDKRFFDKAANRNCAVHFTKDLMGNLYSGEQIITATDYKKFLITWSCLKYSQEKPDLCDDPGMSIFTRHPDPSKHTLHVIDQILKQQFDLVLADLDKMTHNKPC